MKSSVSGVDDQAVKVVDIVDTFRLQEQPPFDKKQFVTYIKLGSKLFDVPLDVGSTRRLVAPLIHLTLISGDSTRCFSSPTLAPGSPFLLRLFKDPSPSYNFTKLQEGEILYNSGPLSSQEQDH
ncbi:hypothetical protein L6452_27284 [Arctium lappa]|uniref:Uncharacterized protein n=1 Tax=Arctium lappa TaxID=4217 RepID=A0ACB8ZWW8_ARCLA|nr:hypothetical protein L6452_27284 [Arctium lappa]